MENCTIYSHTLNFEKVVQIVREEIPKAEIDLQDGGKQKSLVAKLKGGFFSKPKTLRINYRERLNPSYTLDKIECDLTQNLVGMINYIQSIPTQNSEVTSKFLMKVMSVNCEMPFIVDPKMNSEFEKVLKRILAEQDAFVFTSPSSMFNKSQHQHFLDKNLNLVLDGSGRVDVPDIDVFVDANYKDEPQNDLLEDQLSRKEKSEVILENFGIKTNKNLPCIISEKKVELRTLDEVIDRVYGLLIIAAKGEGVEKEKLDILITRKKVNSLTSKEKEVYSMKSLTENDRAYATWRYESLYTLLWAIGVFEDLKFPNDICNVQEVVKSMIEPTRESFENSVTLKNMSVILDELDKMYRMNWACVNARINGEKVSGGVNPSVIYERHYALNWLIKHDDLEWDDVRTDT